MFLKISIKVLFIVAEILLGFYSLAMSDSLLVKFLFFVFTAALIAFIMVKFVGKMLPGEKDYLNYKAEEEK